MDTKCEKCQGSAAIAAQTRSFEYEGLLLHCIVFVSSCVICGHRWEDSRYRELNLRHAERACAVASRRQVAPGV